MRLGLKRPAVQRLCLAGFFARTLEDAEDLAAGETKAGGEGATGPALPPHTVDLHVAIVMESDTRPARVVVDALWQRTAQAGVPHEAAVVLVVRQLRLPVHRPLPPAPVLGSHGSPP